MSAVLTTHTDEVRRWWILRGPDLAVSLTAIRVPDGAPPLTSTVLVDGEPLLPDAIEVHRPGNAVAGRSCPALGRDCDGGTQWASGTEVRRLLRDWAVERDDAVLYARLAEVYAEASAPVPEPAS